MKQPITQFAARRYCPRGSAYVAVLSMAMIVTVIGLSSVAVMRTERRVLDADIDAVKANIFAQSAIDLIAFRLSNDLTWRATHTHNTWTTDEHARDVTFSYKVVDEQDGDLTNDPTQPVRLYARATVGNVTRLYSVMLDAPSSTNILVNGDFEDGVNSWTGFGLQGNATIESHSDGDAHGGAAYMWIKNRENQYGGPSQDITSKITNGGNFYSEVWVKPLVSGMTFAVVIDMDTTMGLQYDDFQVGPLGTGWTKLSGVLTPTWTGTLNVAYWHIDGPSTTFEYKVDDALLLIGTGTSVMVPVHGTWREEMN